MKILQVITSLRIGGAEKLIAEISPMLQEMGNEVDVLVFDGVETHFTNILREAGIRIISFGENCNVYNPLFIFKLAKIMRHYDVVHTHNTAPQLFSALASLLCSVMLCTTEHTTSNRRRDWKWYAWIDRWMYGRYKKVICISDQAKENLLQYLPNLNNVCTIFNGVNINKFHTAEPLPDIHKTRSIIVMVAGFRYQKDQDTLIKAMHLLDKDKYELWLVGDGERRTELKQLVHELNLENNVKFCGIRSDVESILRSSDYVVMSSHFEGLSLSSVEGMSVGKPFIASDVDGLHEVVSGYGILFPHQDYRALAAEIVKLSGNKDYYKNVSDKCWERAQMFDIKNMVQSYNKVYQSL